MSQLRCIQGAQLSWRGFDSRSWSQEKILATPSLGVRGKTHVCRNERADRTRGKKVFILRVAVLYLKYNKTKDKQLLYFRYLKYIRRPARNFNRLQRIEILMSAKYSKTFFRTVRSLNTKMSELFFCKNPAVQDMWQPPPAA